VNDTVDRFVAEWHRAVASRDAEAMSRLLSEEVVFRSPVFWKERVGKSYTAQILAILSGLFDSFTYVKVYRSGADLCFQFEAEAMGKSMRGVDLITLDDAGKVASFEVMIRPLNGLVALGEKVQALFGGSSRS